MKRYIRFIFTVVLFLAVVELYLILSFLWRVLEVIVDGAIHTSNADTIINIFMTYLLSKNTVTRCIKALYKL